MENSLCVLLSLLFSFNAVAAVEQKIISVKASSNLKSAGPPSHLLNGKDWCEGVSGPGIGEWVEFKFTKPVRISSIYLRNGFYHDDNLWKAKNRVKKLTISLDSSRKFFGRLTDTYDLANYQSPKDRPNTIKNPHRFTEFKTLRLTINQVYKGEKSDDTCLSDINFTYWNSDEEKKAAQ
jgi:hypothetical protein